MFKKTLKNIQDKKIKTSQKVQTKKFKQKKSSNKKVQKKVNKFFFKF